ncbi:MAG: adenosylmethionine--8-amino-7-oxononanoate transaminase [Gemmatimonadota bacterium]
MTDLPDPGQLERWDDRHLWHPFTPHSVYRGEDPLTFVAADGHYLIDAGGERYLDGVASIWCAAFGHRREEIDAAVREQLDRVAHATLLGNANDRAVMLARRLAELAPGALEKVFFSDDGSTSVEVAVKMALQFWQQADGGREDRRTKFLSFSRAYHGDTTGAVSLGGIDLFHARFRPLLFEVVRAPTPDVYRRPESTSREEARRRFVDAFDRLMDEHGDELAAVVMEPGMQAAGGMIPYPDGFLRHVRDATREHGTFLVLDEVAMGMGRSGAMFACEREGVVPDFLCLAKGLTGGYLPVAATLTTDRVYEAFLGPPEEGRTFFHGHTYTGNPLGCAAALATLDVFEGADVLEQMPARIAKLREELGRLEGLAAADGSGVGDVRQYGLAAGAELVADVETGEPFDSGDRVGHEVCRRARDRGVFLRPLGDVIVFMPPLTVEEDEIETIVDAVEHGVRATLGA